MILELPSGYCTECEKYAVKRFEWTIMRLCASCLEKAQYVYKKELMRDLPYYEHFFSLTEWYDVLKSIERQDVEAMEKYLAIAHEREIIADNQGCCDYL
ncbi:hypothetical protein E4N72_05885 [Treponema vincentii]|uniref:hypothetical protein n=1 Tax=Treponema vincentii TaxID=69710 RepID=UPI0020A57A69|nr:hypothetical protein [Treponema vincentii]UTC46121.1 hypothetical protein E4N72_05885 [Treponema vincentii]